MPEGQQPPGSGQDIKKMYRTIEGDHFPSRMRIILDMPDGSDAQELIYEKIGWEIGGEMKGLRYGENPGQEAAGYRLVNGNLVLGGVQSIKPGQWLASNVTLLQSGKHPGKTNITDADNALNILRYLTEKPSVVIVKHNNPCGVAQAGSLAEAYVKADLADRIAAFGGAIALNRECDIETAKEIARRYAEVVVAPGYQDGVMDILSQKKDLRIMEIKNMARLQEFVGQRYLEFKSLIDGGQIVQWSFVPKLAIDPSSWVSAKTIYKGKEYNMKRQPTQAELDDLIFGWLVEAGVSSNSVLYVKDRVTVSIGTGGQDRVGIAESARDKAYRNLMDRMVFEEKGISFNGLCERIEDEMSTRGVMTAELKDMRDYKRSVEEKARTMSGGLKGTGMVSDAFFPLKDGILVGLREGVTAVIQPGGSDRDYEVIEAANKYDAAMIFTGQRSFKH